MESWENQVFRDAAGNSATSLRPTGAVFKFQPGQALKAIQAQGFKLNPWTDLDLETAKVLVKGNQGLRREQGIQANMFSHP